jgi:hypothetical protein
MLTNFIRTLIQAEPSWSKAESRFINHNFFGRYSESIDLIASEPAECQEHNFFARKLASGNRKFKHSVAIPMQ